MVAPMIHGEAEDLFPLQPHLLKDVQGVGESANSLVCLPLQ